MHNKFLLETCVVLQEKIKNIGGIFEAPASMALAKGHFTYLDQLFTLWKVSSKSTLKTLINFYKYFVVFRIHDRYQLVITSGI
jgi:hypothetical protein